MLSNSFSIFKPVLEEVLVMLLAPVEVVIKPILEEVLVMLLAPVKVVIKVWFCWIFYSV